MSQRVILWAAFTFTVLFGFLTLLELFLNGPDVLMIFAVLVLAMFGRGIFGALREP